MVYFFFAQNPDFFANLIEKLNKMGNQTVLFTSREQFINKFLNNHPKVDYIIFQKSSNQEILIKNLQQEMGYKCAESQNGELPDFPEFIEQKSPQELQKSTAVKNQLAPQNSTFTKQWRFDYKQKNKISPQLFKLLEIFLDNIEQNQSVENLCQQLWNSTEKNYRQTLYQYIHDLRHIFEKNKNQDCNINFTIEKTGGSNYCLYQL